MTPDSGSPEPKDRDSVFCRTGLRHLFRALSLTRRTSTLLPAFFGVAMTFIVGFALDWLWPKGSRPIVMSAGSMGVTELDFYVNASGNASTATRQWIKDNSASDSAKRGDIFSLLLDHARRTVNSIMASVVALSPVGVFAGLMSGLSGAAWLFSMHLVYGIIFSLSMFLIWGYFGGAVCRAAALRFARDEEVSPWDAMKFARERWIALATAPMIPVFVFLIIALVLWLIGLFGAIPWLGELGVGIAFVKVIVAGMAATVIGLGGMLVFPLLSPSISTDDLDPGDAISTSGNLVIERPWKYLGLLLTALIYGSICLIVLKLFVAFSLWIGSSCTGASMNWGSAAAAGEGGAKVSINEKLSAMWQGPRPGDGRPFYGTFDERELRFPASFAQRCIRAWILVLWGFVAAFAVSFYYSASTIVYFIMRRDVNETDMEDVYLERADSGVASPDAVRT